MSKSILDQILNAHISIIRQIFWGIIYSRYCMSLLFIYILCGFFKWKLRNTSTSNFKQKQQLYLFIFLRLSLCLFSFSRFDKFPWPRSKPTKKKEMTQNHAPVFLFLLFKGIFPVITHLVITNMFYKMYNFIWCNW